MTLANDRVERLRKNFYHLWKPLHELYLAPDTDPFKLEEWMRAPKGSVEWRKAKHHDEALRILRAR